MFIHTCVSAPKRFAKIGRQKRTFVGKKRKKPLAKLKSDRLTIQLYHTSIHAGSIYSS